MRYFQAIITAAIAAVAAYMQQLVIPIIVLIIVMALDYASGVAAAYVSKELSSRTGIIGIIKKVSYLAVVAVGVCIDYIIELASAKLGADLTGYYFVGLLIVVWLIINELISILENTNKLGLPVPAFIGKILAKLKSSAEEKME